MGSGSEGPGGAAPYVAGSRLPGRRRLSRPARLAAHLVVLFLCAGLTLKAAQEPQNDFHFSIIGDRTGGARPGVYGRVWREISLLHPDFVISVGDTIEGGNDATAATQWDQVAAIWRKYEHFPLYLTPGNHDIWSPRSEEIWREKTGRQPFYSFNYQDAHFVVLDNSRQETLSDEQLNFLEADLQQNADRSPKLVFFHRPFWIPYVMLHFNTARLHRVCKKYGVGWVISGHGHQLASYALDGVHYLEIGSSGGHFFGAARGEGFERGWFYQHAWVTVRHGRVQVTIKELDGPDGKGRIFDIEQWRGTQPTFPPDDPGAAANEG